MINPKQNDDQLEKALAVHELLIEEYGQREWRPRLDPLSELIFSILSQNTSDVNRDRAWKRLRDRFPTWESVLAADTAELCADELTAGWILVAHRALERLAVDPAFLKRYGI